MGGSSRRQTVGYQYLFGLHAILCRGPVDHISRLTFDNKTAWEGTNDGTTQLNIDRLDLFGGERREGGVRGLIDVEMGGGSQAANTYLAGFLTDLPGHRGVLGLVFRHFYWGMNPYVKRFAVRVQRILAGGSGWYDAAAIIAQPGASTINDMNPAHIIYELLTNNEFGLGYTANDIDEASFTAAADTLVDEGFGLSYLWSEQTSVEDFIREVTRTINASLFLDKATGRFRLKLIRNDYDVGTLLTLGPNEIIKMDSFNRRRAEEVCNSVVVKYKETNQNKDGAVEAQDIGQIQMQGQVISTTVNYTGVKHNELASKLAARDLQALSFPAATCTLTATTAALPLNIGDPFLLDWADADAVGVVMRVVSISYGNHLNNEVRIQATQDVFRQPSAAFVVRDTTGWTSPDVEPAPVVAQVAFEVPYYELVQAMGQSTANDTLAANPLAGYVGVAAVPAANHISAIMSTDAGAGMEEVDPFEFCPSAVLSSAANQAAVTFTITDLTRSASIVPGTHAQIGNEIVVVTSVVGSAVNVGRGALDTVPAVHPVGTRIFFWDLYAGSDPTEYDDAETVDVAVTTTTARGQLDIGDATVASVTLNQRALRPYPPGDVEVNGSYYPTVFATSTSLVVTWAHRDRLQQTGGALLSFLDGSVGPEAGTTYTLRAYDHDTNTLLDEATAVSGTTATVEPGAFNGYVRLELSSVRDGLESWQRHEIVFAYGDVSVARVSEDGDNRVTEDNNDRIVE